MIRLDGSGPSQPKVFGVCGLAIGVLPDHANGDAPIDVLAVGSLDGQLLIYERNADGSIGPLRYQTRVEGAVGNYNAIVFADLDGLPGNELYVAGSLGLRRWR
ncbi:MAG: hypothetical protein AB7O97_14700 [Planctomycetota bacterium]